MTRRRGVAVVLGGLLLTGAACGWRRVQQESVALAYDVTASPSHVRPWRVEAHDYLLGLWWAHRTARRVAPVSQPDEERLRRLAAWVFDRFIGWEGAAPVREDHFLNVARRGYGYCDQVGHVLATLYWSAGYPARLRMLRNAAGVSPHTVVEVRLHDRWVVVDPFFKWLFESADGRLLTVQELERHPEQFAAYRAWAHRCGVARSGQERWLEIADFQRGNVFTTVPYIRLRDLLHKMTARFSERSNGSVAYAVSVPAQTAARVTGREQPSAARSSVPPEVWRRLDQARWHELTGADAEARAAYRALVDDPLVHESVKRPAWFWLAAAAWRARDRQGCQSALEHLEAIGEPATLWKTAAEVWQGRCAEGLLASDSPVQ